MKYSNETIQFVDDLVRTYSHYDPFGDCNSIYISDIPDFELCKFSSLMMISDNDYVSEAIGPDNEEFLRSIQPALVKFLLDISNKIDKEELISTLSNAIPKYFKKSFEEILLERLNEYNGSQGFYKQYPSYEIARGFLPWN